MSSARRPKPQQPPPPDRIPDGWMRDPCASRDGAGNGFAEELAFRRGFHHAAILALQARKLGAKDRDLADWITSIESWRNRFKLHRQLMPTMPPSPHHPIKRKGGKQ